MAKLVELIKPVPSVGIGGTISRARAKGERAEVLREMDNLGRVLLRVKFPDGEERAILGTDCIEVHVGEPPTEKQATQAGGVISAYEAALDELRTKNATETCHPTPSHTEGFWPSMNEDK